MPVIPKTHQYYPSVPLSEMTDLYSKGDNRLNGERICILSFLSKTLRISEDMPFNNKYFLYIENTENVTSIDWEYKLFNNGESITLEPFLEENTTSNDSEYNLVFFESIVDANDQPVADKLVVTCKVVSGANEVVLSVEHGFVKALNSTGLLTADETKKQTLAFSGDPKPTNYVLNHLKDYLQESSFVWNNNIIELDLSGESTLLKIITSIIYYNVEVTSNDSPIFPFFFDINEYKSAGIENYINDVTPSYEGDYINGVCRIPLHILSDVMSDVTAVPDYTEINTGLGNPIFNIMRDAGLMTYNNLLGDVLRTVPQQIQDSKFRLRNDENKLVELFNLTLFPKSSIKLAAILIKYLFESSKLNGCNECLYRSDQWLTLTIDGFKNHPSFLRNILTHYFREPINSIKSFTRDAKKVTSLVWSPATYLIINAPPRIIKAYFARKIVSQIGLDGPTPILSIGFEKLDSETIRIDPTGAAYLNQPDFDVIFGSQIYIVIETLQSRNKELTLNVRPRDNNLSGDQNNLELFRVTQNVYQDDFTTTVGSYADVRNNNNDAFNTLNQEIFNIDHKDNAVVRLRLKPDTEAEFNDWANRLAQRTVNLEINTRFSDNSLTIFGNDITSWQSEDSFVNNTDRYRHTDFRIVNRILYEIYSDGNDWNILAMSGANRLRLGEIDNPFIKAIADASANIGIRRVFYYYYDAIDTEHIIDEDANLFEGREFSNPRRRANGQTVSGNSNPANVPAGWTSSAAAPAGGDAAMNYYYPNGDIVTRDTSGTAPPNTDYGIKRYPRLAGNVELVRMTDNLDVQYKINNEQKVIRFVFVDTQRRFANPGCYAAFIGVLGELNYNDVECSGMCFGDATSFPSVSHPNGDSIDTHHLINAAGGMTAAARRTAIVTQFRNLGFTQILSGSNPIHNTDGADDQNALHNSHLHSGDFINANSVDDIVA